MAAVKLKVKIGEKFGDLTVISEAQAQFGSTRVLCKCACGKVVERFLGPLSRPGLFKKSCGCSKPKIGRRKRMGEKPYEGTGAFNPVAQMFYLGQIKK
jgi:hypothetical protein